MGLYYVVFFGDPSLDYAPNSEIIKIVDDYHLRANLKNELNLNFNKDQYYSTSNEFDAFANKLISYGLTIEIENEQKQIEFLSSMQWKLAVDRLEKDIKQGKHVIYLADPNKSLALADAEKELKENISQVLN